MRALQMDLTEDAPAWACHQLEMGTDTRHLRILAGLSGSDGRGEIEDACDLALKELGIRTPPPADAARLYAVELGQEYLDGNIGKDLLLQTLCTMYIHTNFAAPLYPFYKLRWTWDDLKTQTFSFYEEKATGENFDDLLLTEIEILKKTIAPDR